MDKDTLFHNLERIERCLTDLPHDIEVVRPPRLGEPLVFTVEAFQMEEFTGDAFKVLHDGNLWHRISGVYVFVQAER